MSSHDDDILDFDFEFGDTSSTGPEHPRGGGSSRSGSEGRGSGSRGGMTPFLRLIGLIALAILCVVLLVVWVQGCVSEQEKDRYADYTAEIGAVGTASQQLGTQLAELLTSPGLEQTELEVKLAGLTEQQVQGVVRAREIDPPGPAHDAHESAIQALEFRVSGLEGLLKTFRATKDEQDAATAGQLLAAQGQRLITSDVVWDDLFRTPLAETMASEGVSGVAAPDSNFAPNTELYSSRSMTSIWQRIHGDSTDGSTASGLHGTGIAYVKVLPSGQQLSATTETTIAVSTELGFEVGVTNSGDFQEVQVEVTLTIPKLPSPIVKEATIDVIDPEQTKTVIFKQFPEVPFGEKTTVQVDVKPVPGETNTANNTAEYPVIFSLG